ncbi:FG-GAP-like repeat-containing protein [Polaribacter porphyrae]|nr:FG-GAP-like repeat-containing protein [Polaribacter porphyrae]
MQPKITISGPTSVTEGVGTIDITITSDIISSQDIRVGFSLPGTAIYAVDYTSQGLFVTIPAGDTSASKTFTIVDDNIYECTEYIDFEIFSVQNGEEDGTQVVTTEILDNDSSVTHINFTKSTQALPSSLSIQFGEFDENSGLDFVLAKAGTTGAEVYTNNGSGTFAVAFTTPTSGNISTRSVVVGDFNNSGVKEDFIINSTSVNNPGAPWINDNNGAFTEITNTPFTLSFATYGLQVFDFDKNGVDDLVNVSNQSMRVFINNYFSNNNTVNFDFLQSVQDSAFSVHIADMDNDGIEDFIIVKDSDNPKIYKGLGSRNFVTNPIVFGRNETAFHIDVAEITGDNYPEILISRIGTNSEIALYTTSDGLSYTELNILPNVSLVNQAKFADLDKDGDFDIVLARMSENLILENINNTSFQESPVPFCSNATSLAIGDIDNDGDVDIIFAREIGKNSEIWVNESQTLSTEDINIQNNIILFPNPAKTTFQLSSSLHSIKKVTVYSLLGGKVAEFINSNNYNISNLSKGIYNLEIITEKGKGFKKLIVE